MIAIEINTQQFDRLAEACKAAGKRIKTELAGAINATSKKTKLEMGREIRATVNIKKAVVEGQISVIADATPGSLRAIVRLNDSERLGLNSFGAKQDKRGVSYKISKMGGRSRIEGAFLVKKWNNRVFVRKGDKRRVKSGRNQGKMKQPIVQRYGVSPWGAFVKNNMTGPQVAAISAELTKQIERRINLNVLRASGLVKT